MNPYFVLESFLLPYRNLRNPVSLLLALSGGPDSLCLFHCLLAFKKKHSIIFHVAHVDHGWRPESSRESEELRHLAELNGIPFHLKRLDPNDAKGNLEEFCRNERYSFFRELSSLHSFSGVMIGHHSDDQAETVLKRFLEGAHWSRLTGLKSETKFEGLTILRPFLSLKKKDILVWLKDNDFIPFEDKTNEDIRFLRARMRRVILPDLNRSFGKNIENSLNRAGAEAGELVEYFDAKIAPFLSGAIDGPFGICLDLRESKPQMLVEMKYLIRKFCELRGFYLSRSLIDLTSGFLFEGTADRRLEMGDHVLFVDRSRLFIPAFPAISFDEVLIKEKETIIHNKWKIRVSPDEEDFSFDSCVWKGKFSVSLPKGEYKLALAQTGASFPFGKCSIGKWWSNRKVPVFLRRMIPVVWSEGFVYHEFLTGKMLAVSKPPTDRLNVYLEFKA